MRCTIAASLQMADEPYFYPDVLRATREPAYAGSLVA
jgi:hypothetical protein